MSTHYDSSLEAENEDEDDHVAAAGADDLVAGDDDGENADPPDEPLTLEARARTMGWKPAEEYRGDPRRWCDAEEFIRRGEEELPILRDQGRRMAERLARTDGTIAGLQAELAAQKRLVEDAMKTARTADERGYQRALRELKELQRDAVRSADEQAFDQVEEQIRALEETRAAVVEVRTDDPPPPPATPQMDPAIAAFVQREASWFNDPAKQYLRTAMVATHSAVIAKHPTLPEADRLELAFDRVRQDFPEEFPDVPDQRPRTPVRRVASPAAPTSAGPVVQRRSVDPFAEIPAEDRADARKAYERARQDDPDMTAREYVTIYNNPRISIRELRAQRRRS